MTYEQGRGFYINTSNNIVSGYKINYIRLPNNVSDLNDYVCGPMNRQGPTCSQWSTQRADGFNWLCSLLY